MGKKTKITMTNNWAELNQIAIDGIIEYNNYASEKFNTFSVGYEPEDYKELCTVVAHLLICNKMLLLHIDENYRRLNEPTPSN